MPRTAPLEQIYYTQCPTGYGLGASGGFQIKRKTPGYPVAGDFRHLAYRAFLPGTRTLAPAVLRYRRDEESGTAEVAYLTPRPYEYETERGLWGRPGGHFAHGLRLEPEELARLDNWPAGLREARIWRRGDPEPSLGRAPEPIEPGRGDLLPPVELSPTNPSLPALLAATARAVREGRTLFLIDEPDHLADRIALLTWAFPSPLRPDLTFSTFHERPEELPGLRLQGTALAARPNRPALLSLGAIADLTAGTIDPPVEVPRWAETLAAWSVQPGGEARSGLDRRARSCRLPETTEDRWTDAWLDGLVGVELALQSNEPPTDEWGWRRIAELAGWSARNGLGNDWSARRGAPWWLAVVGRAPLPASAFEAFSVHLKFRGAWPDPAAASTWGRALGLGFVQSSTEERRSAIRVALEKAPEACRPAFVGALVSSLPPEAATLDRLWLSNSGLCGRGLLLPFAAPDALASLEAGDLGPLRTLLTEAIESEGALVAVLDALAACSKPSELGPLASHLAGTFDKAHGRNLPDVENWPLGRDDAATWLRPYWTRVFQAGEGRDDWRLRRDRVPALLRPAFARVVLGVAAELAAREPFRWAVEEVLLTLPASDRPVGEGWADAYLSRSSLYSLVASLSQFKDRGLRAWIDADRDDLEPRSRERFRNAQSLLTALAKRRPDDLAGVDLADVQPEERGALLALLKRYLAGDSNDAFTPLLDRCVVAWPGAFEAGAPGLEGLARPLAEALGDPTLGWEAWLSRLSWLLGRIGLHARNEGLEYDGLASEIVALASKGASRARGLFPWREMLLHAQGHWPLLYRDIQRHLRGKSAAEVLALFLEWDHALNQGTNLPRFCEVFFNACDRACPGAVLAALLASRAAEIKPYDLAWWDHRSYPDAKDDLRDAFSRRAPMAPVALELLAPLREWLVPRIFSADPLANLSLSPEDDAIAPRSTQRDESRLSAGGLVRWRFIEALTDLEREGSDPGSRRETLGRWTKTLPAAGLSEFDRRALVARLVYGADAWGEVLLARLASWLVHAGERESAWVADWPGLLQGAPEVTDDRRRDRRPLVLDFAAELTRRIGDLRPR
ncbi:hypothetical protein EP7_004497 [Isosphaeraceae bacterium EP7]